VKLAVLGATGSVGRELVTQALAAGHEVTALVREQPKPGEIDDRVALASPTLRAPRPWSARSPEATQSSARSATRRVRPTTSSPARPRT
jgi:uncharacterized protein YbjT (DUF2867 family)